MTFHSGYQSYLVRFCRQEQNAEGSLAAWQITLDNIQTGERLVFGAPQMLFDYLAGCFLPSHAAGGMYSGADESQP